jgi:hypothetical protein
MRRRNLITLIAGVVTGRKVPIAFRALRCSGMPLMQKNVIKKASQLPPY